MIKIRQKTRSAWISPASAMILACVLSDYAYAQSPKPAPKAQPSGVQASANVPPAVPDVPGVWIDHTGRGAIEITPCGPHLCGYVYWVKDPLNRQGKPVVDAKNPDPLRRGKPMCGTQILVNLARQGPAGVGSVWGSGSIYNPEEGASFDAEIKLVSANQLSVLGYLGIKIFGESFTWTRAPADLARCGPPRI